MRTQSYRSIFQGFAYSITLFGVLLTLMAAAIVTLSGCSATVGSETNFDESGRPKIINGSPVTLTIEDDVKKGTANGAGPARYTSINPDGIQTFQSGSTPRDLYAEFLPDGSKKIVLSSGTDIFAKDVVVDPQSGVFQIGSFGTSASEPIRAGNEAYDRLASYWAARDEASKQAIIAELKAYEAAGEAASGVIGVLIKALAPVPTIPVIPETPVAPVSPVK